jgi:hypothetical protein
MPSLMSNSLTLPITQVARDTAHTFAHQQLTPEKAQQVYLNTLAVWVVQDYLALMDIPCDLQASDSWNPVVRLCADVADLVITGIGTLECRPVLPNARNCVLPPEVWCDRIGYAVVVIAEDHRQANILGFTPSAAAGSIFLDQLQSLESLLAHISEFMTATAPQQTALAAITDRPPIDLGKWLQGVFDQSWQAVDSLLSAPNPEMAFNFRSAGRIPTFDLDPEMAFNFRSAGRIPTFDLDPHIVHIKRGKQIQFQDEAEDLSVVLILNLLQTEVDSQRMIRVQLLPSNPCAYLLANLSLRILDANQSPFLEAQSRLADNCLQLLFNGLPGEQFHLSLEYENQRVTETFVI